MILDELSTPGGMGDAYAGAPMTATVRPMMTASTVDMAHLGPSMRSNPGADTGLTSFAAHDHSVRSVHRIRTGHQDTLIVDWGGWAIFGLIATAALTAVMIGAQLVGWTRLDVPLMLGTLLTLDPDRARVAGFFLHLVNGHGFAFGYAASFAALGRSGWWIGGLLGLLHGAVALLVIVPLLPGVHPRMASDRAGLSSGPALEPPGLGGVNYGRETPLVTLVAHAAFGVALGLLLDP